MPTFEITRSMLVNQGLRAHPALIDTLSETDDSTDLLKSFRQFITDDKLSVKDQNLIETIGAFTSPLELATFFINAKYAELNGAGGLLGTTVAAVTATTNSAGFSRAFQNGTIYWHSQAGAHELHGPIHVRWRELGGENGFLGFPTTDVMSGADIRSEGQFAHFQGGSIYWAPLPSHNGALLGSVLSTDFKTARVAPQSILIDSQMPSSQSFKDVSSTRPTKFGDPAPNLNFNVEAISPSTGVSAGIKLGDTAIRPILETSAGAFEVHGAIREKYLALGAEASILGYPRTDEKGTPDGIGRFNHFQGGSIYWTPGTSAHEVHGLIRDRWASLGWEQNPQFGYPITDELIPDPRIGHRRPEVIKKPVLSLPNDVIKLPADAIGFPRSVVNTPTESTAVAIPSVAPTKLSDNLPGAIGKLSDRPAHSEVMLPAAAVFQPAVAVTLNPSLGVVSINQGPASTPSDQRSVNRFADFENGVLFWFRGATSASGLAPTLATADGTSLSFTGADITAIAISRLGRHVFESTNAALLSMGFVGMTGYSFDGVQVHNRRHKIQLILQGQETQTFGGIFSPQQPLTATVELQVEVWFDALQRRITLTPIDWRLTQSNSSSFAESIRSGLRAKLDPLLWSNFELVTLPDTDGGAPIAVLSVKSLPNGTVAVYIEPRHHLRFDTIGNIVDHPFTPSTGVLLQPNS